MRAFTRLSSAILLSAAVFGQPQPQPVFEASDVRAAAPTRFSFMRGPFVRGDRYELRNASMLDLVSTAYGLEPDYIWSGPSWLEMDRFDISAKVPANGTKETWKPMLQALLADRFKLVVHNDTRAVPAFALTAGKHPALKPAAEGEGGGCEFTQSPRPSADGPSVPAFGYTCRGVTMAGFVEQMRDMFGGPEQPVVDRTGLQGRWDFSFHYTPRGLILASASERIHFSDAIEKQLGLKLDPIEVPKPVVVVDSVNRKPTENSPDLAKTLSPQPPPEFEVAAIKPSNPEMRGRGMRAQPGGEVSLRNWTLGMIIPQAWDILPDMIAGAPKWLNEDHFDIIAKAEPGSIAGGMDGDTVWLMMRALLADRFKLAVHFEMRPMPAYKLVAVKPKLKPADPSSRSRFREGPAIGGKDDPRDKNPALSRLVTCQNMTMAQFAEELRSIASGYIRSPVLDATGLDGSYDFTLSFSPAVIVAGGRGGGGRGGDPGPSSDNTFAAAEPSGGITLFEAIEKQLGLKLESEKRPVRVLVIDHLEPKPTEN